jgi:hypothetical protein
MPGITLPEYLPFGLIDIGGTSSRQPAASLPPQRFREYVWALGCSTDNEVGSFSLSVDEWDGVVDVSIPRYQLEHMTDEQVLETFQRARQISAEVSAYTRLRSFLQNPRAYGSARWTLDDLRKAFAEEHAIATSPAACETTEWATLLRYFSPYWTGQHLEGGYIYCLHDQQGHYKLGLTKHLDQRIKQLSTQPPFEISLVFAFKVVFARDYEAFLHHRFREKRLRGEWFRLSSEDVESIRSDAGVAIQEGGA